ncbi:hypothetical protein DFH09DRAFT_1316357 [Mycena vulgaris]|nr:hypothetical protein DFH09DRAFT_1316357 [Mycena vulgaris]
MSGQSEITLEMTKIQDIMRSLSPPAQLVLFNVLEAIVNQLTQPEIAQLNARTLAWQGDKVTVEVVSPKKGKTEDDCSFIHVGSSEGTPSSSLPLGVTLISRNARHDGAVQTHHRTDWAVEDVATWGGWKATPTQGLRCAKFRGAASPFTQKRFGPSPETSFSFRQSLLTDMMSVRDLHAAFAFKPTHATALSFQRPTPRRRYSPPVSAAERHRRHSTFDATLRFPHPAPLRPRDPPPLHPGHAAFDATRASSPPSVSAHRCASSAKRMSTTPHPTLASHAPGKLPLTPARGAPPPFDPAHTAAAAFKPANAAAGTPSSSSGLGRHRRRPRA